MLASQYKTLMELLDCLLNDDTGDPLEESAEEVFRWLKQDDQIDDRFFAVSDRAIIVAIRNWQERHN
jgi:hypothetical protein